MEGMQQNGYKMRRGRGCSTGNCYHIPISVVGARNPPRRPNILRHPALADDNLMAFIEAAMERFRLADILVEDKGKGNVRVDSLDI